VVIPGDASATPDRSPAVLVGRRTTSESVESSTSGCSSSDMGPDDIATLTFLAASALAATAVLIHSNVDRVKKVFQYLASVIDHQLGISDSAFSAMLIA